MKEIIKKKKIALLVVPVAAVGVFLIMPSLSVQTACVLSADRPCYDKSSGKNVQFFKIKSGENAFTACTQKASAKDTGVVSVKTARCAEEQFSYCYDGASKNFLRKFDGTCKTSTADACSALATTQQFFFDVCATNGYDNVCFDQYTSEYQGCTRDSWNDCSDHNGNAYRNVLCDATP